MNEFYEPEEYFEIGHPGTGEKIRCSFDEAMRKWFEGFNIPRKFIGEKPEEFSVSCERVRQYLK